eukprot:TRINITY_DN3016_c0_g1_i6.p1 TRINITY_DN3016_c0_g1~~TRINITY_DN3016_c0_g1_i6.p1  ORF type:complete len:842 (+),score=199.65 TRINITY_DN3016_c0_g1_i6:114-2639(+)
MEKLHVLQGQCKRDPEGYFDEFQNQYLRYKSCLETVKAQPASSGEDFRKLVEFISHLADKYKKLTEDFSKDLCELLETYNEQLDGGTMKSLAQALILLRRKKQVETMTLLPLFFKLFNVRDKELRKILQSYIITDIKNCLKKGGGVNERHLQGFLFQQVDEAQEAAAKRALAIVIELWRTFVWRNARTVSVIAHAVQHQSHQIMLAALKFFLGQDQKAIEEEDDEGDSDLEVEKNKAVTSQITRKEYYNAKNMGTYASKKKKQSKLQRAVNSVRKAVRRDRENQSESFAAIQLLHDPQEFAEKLFQRVSRERSIKFDTKIAMMKVISRSIGVHHLMLINFYPLLQKYINPSQKDVTQVLAALVQACHEVVPPDVLQPVLRQLVDNFVHDRARPEVMTIGLKTVRQMCERCPLIMNQDLLQDLTQYQKFKNKEVTAAARGLVGLFRQLAPGMLVRKDRGRSANMDAKLKEYRVAVSKTRVEGVELLEKAMEQGLLDEDGNIEGDPYKYDEDDSDKPEDDEENDEESVDSQSIQNGIGNGNKQLLLQNQEELEITTEDENSEDDSDEIGSVDEEEEEDEDVDQINDNLSNGSELVGHVNENEEEEEEDDEENEEDEESSTDESSDDELNPSRKSKNQADPNSLASLRKEIATLKRKRQDEEEDKQQEEKESQQPTLDQGQQPLLEQQKFISQEEFEAIKELRRAQLVRDALRKHGLLSSSKKRKLQEEAEAYADAVIALEQKRAAIGEYVAKDDEIVGQHKGKASKEERMESIMKGREGRGKFLSTSAKRKQKSNASLSNREKERKKALPMGAKRNQIKRRQSLKAKRSKKNFKGKMGKGKKA